jgi:hypothetical protein
MTQAIAEKKLSDYLLEGAAATLPTQNQMLNRRAPGFGPVYACAVGAACYAKDPAGSLSKLMYSTATLPKAAAELFPELAEFVYYQFPGDEDGPSRLRLGSLIVNLNDVYGKPREEIAAIVKELGY